MFKIRVRHNYLYKLIEELAYFLPEAQYRVSDDTLVTSDTQIVETAKYVFQFQPGLLVIEQVISAQKNKPPRRIKEDYQLIPYALDPA